VDGDYGGHEGVGEAVDSVVGVLETADADLTDEEHGDWDERVDQGGCLDGDDLVEDEGVAEFGIDKFSRLELNVARAGWGRMSFINLDIASGEILPEIDMPGLHPVQ